MPELELGFWKAAVRTVPMPGMHLALERLRKWGVRLGVVSNTSFSEPVIRYELEKHGIARFMEVIVVSAEHAVRKPNPLLFDTAAARIGTTPQQTWFLGDRLDTDIAGAKAAGMTAVWLNTHGSRGPVRAADLTVTSWDELAQHVSTLVQR